MSVELTYRSHGTIVQTLEGEFIDPNDATVTVNGLDTTSTLNAGTTPPVTKGTAFEKALVAGAGTIDLTALPGLTGDETIDGTGLKVQLIKFRGKSTNANPITVTEGVTNGYALLGAAFTFDIEPGQEVTIYGNDATPDVAAGDKTIDISGTGTEVLEVEVVLG